MEEARSFNKIKIRNFLLHRTCRLDMESEMQERKRQSQAVEKQRQYELEMKRLEKGNLTHEVNGNVEYFQARPPKLESFYEDREKMDYFLER